MDPLAVFGWCLMSFWIGQWSVRRATKKRTDVHDSWIDMAEEIARGMRWTRDAHRFAGDEVSATSTSVYRVSGLGKFKITVERLEGETIEGMAA